MYEDTDPVERARGLMGRLAERGEVQSVTVLGSVRNAPGTRFAARGGSHTLVRLEYPGGMVLIRVLWTDTGHHDANTLGSITTAPTFGVVPRAEGEYTAVERTEPWRTQEVAFEGGCLLVGEMRACPD